MDVMLLMRTFRTSGFVVLCCVAAAATPLDPSCDHQPLANGHHRFLLRDIPSDAPDCSSSSWEDQNGMVLVRKTEIDKELVVAVTNVSVTFKKCVKATTYKRECQNLLMVQCNAACSLQPPTNGSTVIVGRTMESWMLYMVTVGLVAVAFIIFIIIFITVRKCVLVNKQGPKLRDVETQEVVQLNKPAVNSELLVESEQLHHLNLQSHRHGNILN